MNQIQIWQLVIDLGLVASVLVMTVRAFKSSRLSTMLPQTRELEGSLRGLIGDAERAGQHLNEQLLHREQNIQRNLTSIQDAESRLSKMIAEAETLHQKLQATRVETIKVVQDLKSGLEQGMLSEQARYDVSVAPQRELRPQVATQQPPQREADFARESFGRGSNENDMAVPPQREQRATQMTAETAVGPDLKTIYEAAETMIKQGAAIEQVARQTRIPVEGVRLLAQMIEIEREEGSRKQDPFAKVPTTDSRLGALGGIKRQTTVL
jgi:hypothetical protein